jgi:hypothetical protein
VVKTGNMVWMESGPGATTAQTWFRIFSNTTTQLLSFNVQLGGTRHVANTAGLSINDGQWHHVVSVRDAASTSVYYDGVAIISGNVAGGPFNTYSSEFPKFKVGNRETASALDQPYQGLLDDMIVYRRALTLTEVQALYNL